MNKWINDKVNKWINRCMNKRMNKWINLGVGEGPSWPGGYKAETGSTWEENNCWRGEFTR